MEYIKAIIYGIIEGITEWLPVSSTGHLILFGEILSLDTAPEFGGEFAMQYRAMFDVVIQLGAILAVIFLYERKLNPFRRGQRRQVLSLYGRLIAATLPAALLGVCLDALCERVFGADLDGLLFCPQVVAAALIVYGIFFILSDRLIGTREGQDGQSVNLPTALAIGCFQALSLVPGTSRSGATMLGARMLGISREGAAEFSFLMGVPVIAGASLLKVKDFFEYTESAAVNIPSKSIFTLVLAGAVAFFVSLATIKLLTNFVKRHGFTAFGIYRIILGVAVLLLSNT